MNFTKLIKQNFTAFCFSRHSKCVQYVSSTPQNRFWASTRCMDSKYCYQSADLELCFGVPRALMWSLGQNDINGPSSPLSQRLPSSRASYLCLYPIGDVFYWPWLLFLMVTLVEFFQHCCIFFKMWMFDLSTVAGFSVVARPWPFQSAWVHSSWQRQAGRTVTAHQFITKLHCRVMHSTSRPSVTQSYLVPP